MGNCVCVEMVSKILISACVSSAAEVSLVRCFVPGEFTSLPGTGFAFILTDKITGVKYAGPFGRVCLE